MLASKNGYLVSKMLTSSKHFITYVRILYTVSNSHKTPTVSTVWVASTPQKKQKKKRRKNLKPSLNLSKPKVLHRRSDIFVASVAISRPLAHLKNLFIAYRISANSFRRNHSFLTLEIVANSNSCCNISIFYLINWIFAGETIQGRKLFAEIRYNKYMDLDF